MTDHSIHQKSFDDIIFEHRNKNYGAYALRHGYNNRLLTALGAGMSVILLGAFIFMNRDSRNHLVPVHDRDKEMLVRTIELPEDKPAEPEKPAKALPQKPAEKTAMVKYISTIKIEKEVMHEMTAVRDLEGKSIGDKDQEGKKTDGTVLPLPAPPAINNGRGTAGPVQSDFTAQEKGPEFPGGVEALKKFLSRNLVSPDNLERGELKTVRVRFRVDQDGSVSSLEILISAGDDFDDEVVRVCRRMPKWIPALQNGINVPVNYILPVTFIGSE